MSFLRKGRSLVTSLQRLTAAPCPCASSSAIAAADLSRLPAAASSLSVSQSRTLSGDAAPGGLLIHVPTCGCGRCAIRNLPAGGASPFTSSRSYGIWSASSSKKPEEPKTAEQTPEEAAAAAADPNKVPAGKEGTPSSAESTSTGGGGDDGAGGLEGELSSAELQAQLEASKASEAKLTMQVADLTDRLMRSLAEMENVRTRSTREVENAKKYGSQGLIKDLLDVPDNLERAAASVPEAALAVAGAGAGEGEAAAPVDAEKLRGLLRGLLEGVQATEKIMLQVLRRQGVEQFNPAGDKFDPNQHSALFEVPDGSKEAGLVAVVTKKGYRMFERVVRPAEVGVTRAP